MSVYLEQGWKPMAEVDHAESERELRRVVYDLVRLLRPRVVAETGAYKGAMTEMLGRAMRENEREDGDDTTVVHSCEPIIEYAEIARQRCQGLPVFIHTIMSHTMVAVETADLLFLDSDYRYRADEIRRAKKGATVIIHDVYKSYDPTIEPLAPYIESLGGLCFRCGIDGRGFGILVKR